MSAFLDRDLDENSLDEVEVHVRECADCREALAELGLLSQASAGLERLEPSQATWHSIRARVERPPARRFRRWVWAGAAAAAALLVVAVAGRTISDRRALSLPHAGDLPRTRESAGAELAAHYRDYVAGVDIALSEIETALAENPSNPRVRMAYIEARTARVRAVDQLCIGGD
ncbi:MAG: zf-HC2 domain-containing protein [bacterium]